VWKATINAKIGNGNLARMSDGCIHIFGHIAADSDMGTIDSLWELIIIPSNSTIANPLRCTV